MMRGVLLSVPPSATPASGGSRGGRFVPGADLESAASTAAARTERRMETGEAGRCARVSALGGSLQMGLRFALKSPLPSLSGFCGVHFPSVESPSASPEESIDGGLRWDPAESPARGDSRRGSCVSRRAWRDGCESAPDCKRVASHGCEGAVGCASARRPAGPCSACRVRSGGRRSQHRTRDAVGAQPRARAGPEAVLARGACVAGPGQGPRQPRRAEAVPPTDVRCMR